MAMKLTLGILAMAMMVSGWRSWAQNPDAIDNARSTAKSLQQKQANAASKAAAVPATAQAGTGRSGSRGEARGDSRGRQPVAGEAGTGEALGIRDNQLQKVNVVPGSDGLQIEISSSQAVTPQVTQLIRRTACWWSCRRRWWPPRRTRFPWAAPE